MKLSIKNLHKIGLYASYIKFIQMHGLEKYSLSDLAIVGDYNGIVDALSIKPSSNCVYDASDRLLSCTNSLGFLEKYTYDENGNMISHNHSAGHSHTWTYGSNNNKLSRSVIDGQSVRWTYNAHGIVASHSDYILHCIGRFSYGVNTMRVVSYRDTDGYHYSTDNLPKGVLCQVYKDDKIVLEITLK